MKIHLPRVGLQRDGYLEDPRRGIRATVGGWVGAGREGRNGWKSSPPLGQAHSAGRRGWRKSRGCAFGRELWPGVCGWRLQVLVNGLLVLLVFGFQQGP